MPVASPIASAGITAQPSPARTIDPTAWLFAVRNTTSSRIPTAASAPSTRPWSQIAGSATIGTPARAAH